MKIYRCERPSMTQEPKWYPIVDATVYKLNKNKTPFQIRQQNIKVKINGKWIEKH